MSYSVWDQMSKRDIDQATEKIIRLITTNRYTYIKDRTNEERDKNARFLDTYIQSEDLREHVLATLRPEDCGDVHIKEEDITCKDRLYIYFVDCRLNLKGDKKGARKTMCEYMSKLRYAKMRQGKIRA